jgi:hypothetical protein
MPVRRMRIGLVGQYSFEPGARPSALFPVDTDPVQRVVPALAGVMMILIGIPRPSTAEWLLLLSPPPLPATFPAGPAPPECARRRREGSSRTLWHHGLDDSIRRSRHSTQQIQQGHEPRADGFPNRVGTARRLFITVRAWLERIRRRPLCQFVDQGLSLEPGSHQQGEEDLHLATVEHAAGDKSLAQEVTL